MDDYLSDKKKERNNTFCYRCANTYFPWETKPNFCNEWNFKETIFLFVFITSCSRKIGHLRGQQTKDETEDSYELINHISNEPSFRFLSFPELLFTCERCPSKGSRRKCFADDYNKHQSYIKRKALEWVVGSLKLFRDIARISVISCRQARTFLKGKKAEYSII